ncbi:hydrogenase maturation protein, partial [Streptomyces sp. NPDC001494]
RVGDGLARRLTGEALPIGAAAAGRIGLVDRLVPAAPGEFGARVQRLAEDLAAAPDLAGRIAAKETARRLDEARRPLAEYRRDELARMRAVFDDPAAPYHALRSAFVRKKPAGSVRPLAPVAGDLG